MASERPSSAPLFTDSWTPGGGLVPTLGDGNQYLGHQAAQHPDQPVLAPNANRVQAGQLPRVSGPSVGAPNAINPAGAGLTADSLEG